MNTLSSPNAPTLAAAIVLASHVTVSSASSFLTSGFHRTSNRVAEPRNAVTTVWPSSFLCFSTSNAPGKMTSRSSRSQITARRLTLDMGIVNPVWRQSPSLTGRLANVNATGIVLRARKVIKNRSPSRESSTLRGNLQSRKATLPEISGKQAFFFCTSALKFMVKTMFSPSIRPSMERSDISTPGSSHADASHGIMTNAVKIPIHIDFMLPPCDYSARGMLPAP